MRLGVSDVSSNTVHRLVAGAVVAEAAMRAVRLPQLEICPWALREGVILRRLDTLENSTRSPATKTDGLAQTDRSAQDAPGALGHLTTYEARCIG